MVSGEKNPSFFVFIAYTCKFGQTADEETGYDGVGLYQTAYKFKLLCRRIQLPAHSSS